MCEVKDRVCVCEVKDRVHVRSRSAQMTSKDERVQRVSRMQVGTRSEFRQSESLIGQSVGRRRV